MIKWLKLLFEKLKPEKPELPSDIDNILLIQYTELDSELKKKEEKEKKKLDDFFISLMLLTLIQLENVKAGQIIFGSKKQLELKILLEEYFHSIEKITYPKAKQIIKSIIPKVRKNKDVIKAFNKVNKLKTPKYSQYNHEYARELSNKEISDYKKLLTDSTKKLLKDAENTTDPKKLDKDLIKLIKEETQKFINQRTKNIVSTEANRNANSLLAKIFKEVKFVEAVRFTAILDDKTTIICRPRDGLILDLETYLKFFLPPLHWHCRSYGVPLGKWNKYELSKKEDWINLPKPWFEK